MKIVRCRPSRRSIAAASRARRSRASSRDSGSSGAVLPPKAGARIFDDGGGVGRHEPAGTPQPRFPPIEAAVDENAGEPDFERPRLAIRVDVTEHLDERVLHHFVGVGRIVQVLIGDAHRPALVNRDELGEALPRRIDRAVGDEVANVDSNPRVVGHGGATGRRSLAGSWRRPPERARLSKPRGPVIEWSLILHYVAGGNCLQFTSETCTGLTEPDGASRIRKLGLCR